MKELEDVELTTCAVSEGGVVRDSCKVRFFLESLTTPVITLPSVSALVVGSFPIFASFGSIAVVNGVTRSLMGGAELVHVL